MMAEQKSFGNLLPIQRENKKSIFIFETELERKAQKEHQNKSIQVD
jgi:hypothetical protein